MRTATELTEAFQDLYHAAKGVLTVFDFRRAPVRSAPLNDEVFPHMRALSLLEQAIDKVERTEAHDENSN